ncbi:MAG: hypothetical protein EP343_27855 [Deltaproteobacteria bacterium]|nr:MAG: hypothetical protein EP343_27855 [Deltaproteobacteria bacterium]
MIEVQGTLEPTSDSSQCPACQQPRAAGDALCPYCGVVYARYKPRSERIVQRSQASQPQREDSPKSERSASGASSGGRRVYLSDAKLESFLIYAAEALEAGLTFQQFTQGPFLTTLPSRLQSQFKAFGKKGMSLPHALEAVSLLEASAIALLQIGETQGKLPASLRVVAKRVELRRRNRRALLGKLSYPVLLVLVHILVNPLAILIMQGPKPYIAAVMRPLLYMGAAAFLVFWWIPRINPNHVGLRFLRTAGAYLPFFSTVRRYNALAVFTETMGSCLQAGLQLRTSLKMSCSATYHPAFENKASMLLESIQQGSTLAEALESIRAIPRDTLAMIAQGELVGSLDQVLLRLGQSYTEKHRAALNGSIIAIGLLATVAIFGYLILSIVSQWKSQVGTLEGQLKDVFKQFQHLTK